MTLFLQLVKYSDKARGLYECCRALREGYHDERLKTVDADKFRTLPGSPFSYWVSDQIRELFDKYPAFEDDMRTVKQGLATADDFRFLRLFFEVKNEKKRWVGFAKGGVKAPFYSANHLVLNWDSRGLEIWNNLNSSGKPKSNIWMLRETIENYFFSNGLTFTLARASHFAPRILPSGMVFGHVGSCIFNKRSDTIALCALFNSTAVSYILRAISISNWEVGYVRRLPLPSLPHEISARLDYLAKRGWGLMRSIDTVEETSHAFLLPVSLRALLGDYNRSAIDRELTSIKAEIDDIAYGLYGFSASDRKAAEEALGLPLDVLDCEDEDDEGGGDEEASWISDDNDHLLSWAVGVAFGRFDWRLATGERAPPPEPHPFDPLPTKSPGMLPDGAAPFHKHSGILVDDPGHEHDLAQLIEEILIRVDATAPSDLRNWLRREFFAFHLQNYSKSRRKAPIYWPLSTKSGSYTLWVYYPRLTSQTLYTAVNDFIDGPNGKLRKVEQGAAELRAKGQRSRDEEKKLDALQELEAELIDLRDTLLRIASSYHPNHDDGVQIAAAPLWSLFRHKPWQKILKDTWVKLEKGDYDWAHLALCYWPDRVREKCKTDMSLAIAHGLEALYVEPEQKAVKPRGRKKGVEA